MNRYGVESVSMTTRKEESEVLSKYLSGEETWLREVQRERGGQVYIETLGEKTVEALMRVVQGGDEVAVSQGMALLGLEIQ